MSNLSPYLSDQAKAWSKELWDGLIRALDARFGPLEEQLDAQRQVAEAIVARGLAVIEQQLAPVVDEGGEVLDEIKAFRATAEALVAVIEGKAEEGIEAAYIVETPQKRFTSDAEIQALIDSLSAIVESLVSHASRTDNPHAVTKAQVGLGSVPNLTLAQMLANAALTGISTAPTALVGTNTDQIATMKAIKQAIDALLAGAPGALDTLLELSAALGNDPNFSATIMAALAARYTKAEADGLLSAKAPLASPTLTGAPQAPTAATSNNSQQIATTAFVKAVVNALVANAPGLLDTLDEIAAALGDDPNFSATILAALAARYTKTESDGRYPLRDSISAIGLASNDPAQPYVRRISDNGLYFLQRALGFTPVQQGGGAAQGVNKIYIGWDAANNRLRAQVDGADLAHFWMDHSAPKSLASNGYIRLPNGFIFQWGYNANPSGSDRLIGFATAFPTACIHASASVSSDGSYAAYAMVDQLNLQGFAVRTRNQSGGAVSYPVNWTAWGY